MLFWGYLNGNGNDLKLKEIYRVEEEEEDDAKRPFQNPDFV